MKKNIDQKLKSFGDKISENIFKEDFKTSTNAHSGFDGEDGIILTSIILEDNKVISINGFANDNCGRINVSFVMGNDSMEYFEVNCNQKNITKKIGFCLGYIIRFYRNNQKQAKK